MLAGVLSGLVACGDRPDSVELIVAYQGNAAKDKALADATAISGDDKVFWYTQKAGETRIFGLYPDPRASDRELTLIYVFEGQERRTWEGPAIPIGRGYRIRIELAADGSVTGYRHCLKPCQLD